MTTYTLPYGHKKIMFDFPEHYHVDLIEPTNVPAAEYPLQVVADALSSPVDGRPINAFHEVHSVAIAVNDKTRPVPHEHLLPPLMDALSAAGIPDSAITLLVAMGTHIPMPEEEYPRILPEEIISRYRVVSHNCDDETNLVYCGETTRGTPVFGNRIFVEADLRIVVGNIEPHHFAGFSGGHKSAAIGLSGRQTITKNHAMLVDPNSRIAEYTRNPLRQDIEEIGDLLGANFALNAILNGQKKIVRAVSGHPRAVMQAGIPISQQICQIQSSGKYDLVIAAVGGAPKDINFYQSQKALSHASLFTRDGGVIVLVAECPEGTGSLSYERFMQDVSTPQQVFEKMQRVGFQVGPHKAFQVARDAARLKIIIISQLDPQLVSRLLMTPAADLSEALRLAYSYLSPTPPEHLRAAILPRATNTIPVS